MRDPKEARRPGRVAAVFLTLARGAAIGVVAGVVQVLAAQLVGLATGRRERTDVAPRLVQRSAERLGHSLSRPVRWLLAAAFHFGYAAFWGALYTALRASRGERRLPWWLAGGALGGVIYTLAFSRIGGGTLIGSERHPDRREGREQAIQWVSAFSFAFAVAYIEQRIAARDDRARSDDANG
jgi:hypothetical protein